MNTVVELFAEPARAKSSAPATPVRDVSPQPALRRASSSWAGQMQTLAQRLFFGHASKAIRHIAVAPADSAASSARLCLDLAATLALLHSSDVGLIDTQDEAPPLEQELDLPAISSSDFWPLEKNLWLVPRGSWRKLGPGRGYAPQDLARLREISAEFDFSVLCCSPVSWPTASVAQVCDGLVVVLAAEKTRRVVATQIKELLRNANVTLLGTVLAERRFPVPEGLYRRL